MAAFELDINLYSYFRQNAQSFECNPCFDGKKAEIEAMNEKGANGVPCCLCRDKTPCPCPKWKQIVKSGTAKKGDKCYCEIFVKL